MREHTAGMENRMETGEGFNDSAVEAVQSINSEGSSGFEGQAPIQQPDNGQAEQAPIQQNTQEAINPAWEGLLNEIPEGFRGQVAPVLKKWDQGVNERFQKNAEELRQYQQQIQQYQPYSEFIQGGMTPEHFKAAQVILNELQSNPQALYQRLGEHFGFAGESQDPEQALNYDETEEEELDPQIAYLAQQQQQMVEWVQQQEHARIQQEANTGIETELAQLNEKYNLSPIDRRETLQRAVLMSQTNPNVSLEEAYRQWDGVKRSMFQQTQTSGNGAPQVISSGGGGQAVTPQKKSSEMSEKEFLSSLVHDIQNL